MSTLEEERRSLVWARKFFKDLVDTKVFPRVPRPVRNKAYHTYQLVDRLGAYASCNDAAMAVGLNAGREFLLSLLNPALTPKVPGNVRDLAFRISKHYPIQYRRDLVVGNFTSPEPLYKGGAIWA